MFPSSNPDAISLGGAYFGAGSSQIALSDVACIGNETNLLDCQHNRQSDFFCFHFEDASVLCQCTYVCACGYVHLTIVQFHFHSALFTLQTVNEYTHVHTHS